MSNKQCWVCGDPATHVNTGPVTSYACADHAVDIDYELISKVEYGD